MLVILINFKINYHQDKDIPFAVDVPDPDHFCSGLHTQTISGGGKETLPVLIFEPTHINVKYKM
jgi:hypothetical protein